jgi:hypothetical protein
VGDSKASREASGEFLSGSEKLICKPTAYLSG